MRAPTAEDVTAYLIGKLGPQDIIDGNGDINDGQSQVLLTGLPNGNYVAVWTDYRNSDNEIYARILGPDGTPVSSPFSVHTASLNNQSYPNVLGLANGDILFVWDSDNVNTIARIYETESSAFVTAETAIGNGSFAATALAEMTNGQLVFVDNNSPTNFSIYDTTLSLQTTWAFTLSPTAESVSVAALQNGNLVFTYRNGDEVAFSVVDPSDGNILIDNQAITDTSNMPSNGTVSVLDNGNFVAVWTSFETDEYGIYATIYDPVGNLLTFTQVAAFESFLNTAGTVTALDDGGFAVTWTAPDGNMSGIFARAFNSDGEPKCDAFVVNTITGGQQQNASIAALTDGRFSIGWVDGAIPGDGSAGSIRTQSYYATNIEQQYQQLNEGSSLVGNVLEDVTPPPGVTLKVQAVNTHAENVGSQVESSFGKLTVQADGSYYYIADTESSFNLSSGHNGLDGFTIEFTDQFGNTITETLFFEISGLDNYIVGTAGKDTLKGVLGVDIIMGEAGNDTISSGPDDGITNASDLMYGGLGDDIYNLLNENDQVIEFEGEGNDTVRISKTYTLTPDVENLELLGTGNINGTGNELNNKITGNSGDNKLDGKEGADTLTGGNGNDSYYVDHASDDVIENAKQGNDTVVSTLANYTLKANVENLLIGAGGVNGKGNATENYITGNSAANELKGEGGNDILTGGGGADQLIGGAGDDHYIITHGTETISEAAGAGNDTVTSYTVGTTLAANVENLFLFYDGISGLALNALGNALKNTITGNHKNNILNGDLEADKMIGGDGDDTYIVDNTGDTITELANEGNDKVQSSATHTLSNHVEILNLTGTAAINGTGNALDNEINGNSGNNILDGKAGADKMYGFDGNDTYVVDDAKDVVSESGAFLGTGNDLVQSSITYTLGQNIEHLTLTGTAHLSGFGNALNNTIKGNSGNNTLNGGTGDDTLVGGSGNDVYFVDSLSDIVTEADKGGTDTVFASVSGYTLGSFVENLTLTDKAEAGTGNSLNNTIIGNGSVNTLTGGGGHDILDGGTSADTLIGGSGNDTYYVDDELDQVIEEINQGTDAVFSNAAIYTLTNNVENLFAGLSGITLNGNNGANTIVGNAGNNFISGNGGNDTLTGGAGDDTFNFLSNTFGKDKITDFSVASGDKLRFLSTTFDDFDDVMDSASQSLSGTVIAYDSGNAILLMGVKMSSLTANDFEFI